MRDLLMAILLAAGCGVAALAQPEAPAKAEPKEATKEEPDKAAEEAAEEPAKEETLDELLARIEKSHKQHKDFAGNFEQEKFLPLFGDKIISSGRFVFKQPDKVRWEYLKPHASILVVTGESGRKWSRATGRTEAFKLSEDRGLDAVVRQLFTWFKGEFTKLKQDYEVEITARGPAKLKLTPKNEILKKYIATIEVQMAKGEDQIASVKLLEPMQKGDEQAGYTLYTFKDTSLDKGVADSEFEITK